jgi:hypothetical protein
MERTPCIGMARDTLWGPFDFAPVTDYRNTFWRRSAQGDRLGKYRQTSRHSRGRLCHTSLPVKTKPGRLDLAARKVNGFWVGVCQDVPFRSASLAENPIDCRIFFADNPGRKTESGIGGKTLETPGKASNPAVCGPPLGPQLPRPHVV